MDISAVRKLVVHPAKLAPLELETVETNALFDAQAEVSFQDFHCEEQRVNLKGDQDHAHEKRKR